MSQKDRYLRVSDMHSPKQLNAGGGSILLTTAVASPSPGFHTAAMPPPSLTLADTSIARSSQSSKSYLDLTWELSDSAIPVTQYIVEYSKSPDFSNSITEFTKQDNISLLVDSGTTYHVRVYAQTDASISDESDTLMVDSESDTVIPDGPTSLVHDWISDDLALSWTPPTNMANVAGYNVQILRSDESETLKTVFVSSPHYNFTKDINYTSTANDPVVSVEVIVNSVSWQNILSTSDLTEVITKGLPPSPSSVTTTWDSDPGTKSAVCIFSWGRIIGINDYVLEIDGVTYTTKNTAFAYQLDSNKADHSGTLDYALTHRIWSRDGLNQEGTPSSPVTVTNAPPPDPTVILTAGSSILVAQVTEVTVDDFDVFKYVFKRGVTTLRTIYSKASQEQFETTDNGTNSYSVDVSVRDVFGRYSNIITSNTVSTDMITLDYLRRNIIFSDDLGTSSTSLDVLKDEAIGAGITYTGAGTPWHWTLGERPLVDRYKTTQVSSTGGKFYIGVSYDNVTWYWFSGPLTGVDSRTLTSVANEAAAKTAAINLPAVITSYDLPTIKEARFIKLGHSSLAGSNYRLDEFYPRRNWQVDDLESDSIRTRHIGALQITADKISVINLAAITISTGALNITGVLTIDTAGGIFQGTGSFASPTTALKIYNSSGIGLLEMWGSSVKQIYFDTSGTLNAGGGNVNLNSNGLTIKADNGNTGTYSHRINFNDAGYGDVFQMYTNVDTVLSEVHTYVDSQAPVGKDNYFELFSYIPTTDIARKSWITFEATTNNVGVAAIAIRAGGQGVGIPTEVSISASRITVQGDIRAQNDQYLSGGLNVGSATGAGTGQIITSSSITGSALTATGAVTGTSIVGDVTDSATTTSVELYKGTHRSSGTPAAGFGGDYVINLHSDNNTVRNAAIIRASWATATDASRKARRIDYVFDTAAREAFRIEASGTAAMIGFLGAAAVIRQTSGANVTNNVTSGGTTDQIDNWTNLSTYATDAAAIRNAIYQLARKQKQINDGLRSLGLFT